MEKDKCRSCRYSWLADVGEGGKMLRACQYILMRGERRPCPAGEACTVWEKRTGERCRPRWGRAS